MSTVDFTDIKLEQRTCAGQTVPVAVVPRLKQQNYFAQIPHALKSLWNGMKLTLGYLVRPSKVVTQQYPENRATLKFPERYRCNLKMIYDEDGHHRCNGCKICEKQCPNQSIYVHTRKSAVTGKNELNYYVWRMDSCVFCNACVMACPTDSLEMTHEFECAVHDRRLLIYNLNRYAGPPADQIAKLDEETRKQLVLEPRGPYEGPVPLAGQAYPNIRPVQAGGGSVPAEGSDA